MNGHDRHLRLDALFERALALEKHEREPMLRELEAEDAALTSELRALLALAATDDDLPWAPAADEARWRALLELAPPDPETAARADVLPGRIGVWTPLRRIGRGGMGTVYRVERDSEGFRQTGALKLLHAGVESDEFLRRFAEERRILATLAHPGIARLLDGGRGDDGRPYLVMEFVDGEPVDRACDHRALDIDARIALFRRIAEAVAYAHRNLVAHRDIKPGNILVGEDGEPKLLDFGIAKALSESAPGTGTEGDAVTHTQLRALTPDYAAPEQVLGRPTSTATDVYQLGLLLYELLTGYRAQHVPEPSQRAIERAVCADEPVRPSERIRDDDRARSAARATAPAALRRKLRGDLDNIVLKALRKAPERRYSSVAALIEDLERWRLGLTVRARPETWAYRSGKFLRRNALAVTAVAAIFALTLGYAFVAQRQAETIARERDRARAEATKAERALELLKRVFRLTDPRETGGTPLGARELLDNGWSEIEGELRGQPALRAEMLDSVGEAYRQAGEYARARTLLERGLSGARGLATERPILLARAERSFGRVLSDQGDFDAADLHLRKALAAYRGLLGPGHAEVADTLSDIGLLLDRRGAHREAETVYRDALALRRALYGERHPLVAESLSRLGMALRQQADYTGAAPLLEQALTLRRQLLPATHPDLRASLSNLAVIRGDMGEYDTAERLYREAMAGLEASLGPDHPEVAIVMNNLALLLQKRGDAAAARPLMEQVLRIRRKALGERHPLTAQTDNDLGLMLAGEGHAQEAEAHYLKALAAYPPGHLGIGATTFNLGQLAEKRGDYATAERRYREAIALQRKDYGEEHDRVGADLNRLGIVLHRRGRLDEAEVSMRQALAIYRKRLTPGHRRLAMVLTPLGTLLLERGRRTEAKTLLEEAAAIRRETLGADDPLTRETEAVLARADAAADRTRGR